MGLLEKKLQRNPTLTKHTKNFHQKLTDGILIALRKFVNVSVVICRGLDSYLCIVQKLKCILTLFAGFKTI